MVTDQNHDMVIKISIVSDQIHMKYQNQSTIIIIIINLTLWRTLQNVIQTQKCVPHQKNQLWTCVFSSV